MTVSFIAPVALRLLSVGPGCAVAFDDAAKSGEPSGREMFEDADALPDFSGVGVGATRHHRAVATTINSATARSSATLERPLSNREKERCISLLPANNHMLVVSTDKRLANST